MTMRTEKVIQFGEGGFLRGFADWMLQIVNEQTDFNGSCVVVQPIATGMCDVLTQQGCVYTHIMRGLRDGEPVVEKKRIDVISRCVKPYDDFDAYLQLADNADFRFVISNTTESGIAFCAGDTPDAAPDVTFPAKVTLLLHRRYEQGLGGFIFLPCELIDRNGDTLKQYVLDYAALWGYGEDFARWVREENIFCNTLVDRIVTGYPREEAATLDPEDRMLNTSELFHLWVIEGPRSILEELPLDRVGLNVIVTDELEKYRTRKVRILNGAHTSMIPYAMLEGIETVRDCMEDATMSAFVRRCVYEEIIPTLDLPREELLSYADDVFERFNNPFIRHLCASISLNSVSKFTVRVLPSLLEYVKRVGSVPPTLTQSLWRLIEFYQNGTPTDDATVIARMQGRPIAAILADATLWGEDISFLTDEVLRYANT